MTDIPTLLDAARLAARAHHGQGIHGTDAVPYLDHVLDVAGRLARHHPGDGVLLTAALLHDAVEDTEVAHADIRARFGDAVADLVAEVTDPPGLPEDARRARQVAHVAKASDRAKRLKMADKAANLAEMVRHPWHDDPADAAAYVDWACDVIDPVRGLDARLEGEFDAAAARARAALARRRR
jgi:guanosine-3',5'-bis(diphosphate) 3'-pyrophosphohydrolase